MKTNNLYKQAFIEHLLNPEFISHAGNLLHTVAGHAGDAVQYLAKPLAYGATAHVGANAAVKAIRSTANNRLTQSLGELGVKHGVQGKEIHPFLMDRIKQLAGPELVAEYTGARNLVAQGKSKANIATAESLVDKAEQGIASKAPELNNHVDAGVHKLRSHLPVANSVIDDVSTLAKAHSSIANNVVDSTAIKAKQRVNGIVNGDTPLTAITHDAATLLDKGAPGSIDTSRFDGLIDRASNSIKKHLRVVPVSSTVDKGVTQAKASLGVANVGLTTASNTLKNGIANNTVIERASTKAKESLPYLHGKLSEGIDKLPEYKARLHNKLDSVPVYSQATRSALDNANNTVQDVFSKVRSGANNSVNTVYNAAGQAKGAITGFGHNAKNYVDSASNAIKVPVLPESKTLNLARTSAKGYVDGKVQSGKQMVDSISTATGLGGRSVSSTAGDMSDIANSATQAAKITMPMEHEVTKVKDAIDSTPVAAYKRLSSKAKSLAKQTLGMKPTSDIGAFPIVGDVQKATDSYFNNGGELTRHTGLGGKIINGVTRVLDRASVPSGYSKGLANPGVRHAANAAGVVAAHSVPGLSEHVGMNTVRAYMSKLPQGQALLRSRVQEGFKNEPVKLFGKFGPKVVEGQGLLGKARRAIGDYGFSPTAWGETRDFGVKARESGMSQESVNKALDMLTQ